MVLKYERNILVHCCGNHTAMENSKEVKFRLRNCDKHRPPKKQPVLILDTSKYST